MLKAIVTDLESVDENHRPLYVERDGGGFILDVEPVDGFSVQEVSGLKNALAAERRRSADAAKAQSDAEARLDSFKDLDPKAARDALKRLAEGPADVESIVKARLDGMRAGIAEAAGAEATAARTELNTVRGTLAKREGQLRKLALDNVLVTELAKVKPLDDAADVLILVAGQHVRMVEEDGELVARVVDRKGEPRLDAKGQNWRDLMVPASYSPSDSGDVVRGAMLDTATGVREVRDAIDRLAARLTATTYTANGDGTMSTGASGGSRPNIRFGRPGAPTGGDMPNMRYGRSGGGGSGSYRSTPGSGTAAEIGPHVSLGKMGSKFAAKAPVIMDGLMKKYGLTREQAAGVLGNLGHESAGFTAYHEGGQASAKGGVGWAQWTGPRRRAFESWTKAHGLNPTSDEASWRYLTEGDPETAKAILAVKRTNNRHDAVRAFHDAYERSADISHGVIVKQKSWNSRLRYADQAFGMQPGGATADAKALGTPANPVTVKVDPKSIGKAPAASPASSPADIAGKVYPAARPRPGTGDALGGMTSADNSTMTNHFHIHGAHDPHAVARTVVAHLDRRSGATIDLDAFS